MSKRFIVMAPVDWKTKKPKCWNVRDTQHEVSTPWGPMGLTVVATCDQQSKAQVVRDALNFCWETREGDGTCEHEFPATFIREGPRRPADRRERLWFVHVRCLKCRQIDESFSGIPDQLYGYLELPSQAIDEIMFESLEAKLRHFIAVEPSA